MLDTHVVVWLVSAPARVPQRVSETLVDADVLAVSVISAWEHGLKRTKRPDQLPFSFDQLLSKLTVERLALDWACLACAEGLPDYHRDPFDRMLIAQALQGRWTLVTADRVVQRYPVPSLW